MANHDVEERLRRLERAAVLVFAERHGIISPGQMMAGGIAQLRATVARDCQAIFAEYREPVEERVS